MYAKVSGCRDVCGGAQGRECRRRHYDEVTACMRYADRGMRRPTIREDAPKYLEYQRSSQYLNIERQRSRQTLTEVTPTIDQMIIDTF